ncbi:MAG TPA: precorrin-6y C5,15-methyltransferase (decarboxylating) subunit CbiE [Burkholderiales bacterium]|nr:precorrin-6y C5,15-methyltransferase (decarboxylating) subunit CbiE [Burkholderiales bacterium]
MPEGASSRRWLSIVGIGEDGVEGLSATARALVSGADIVFGGERHLELAAPLIKGRARPWPSPFARGIEQVLETRGSQVCVLASGDPFNYGVGSVLARSVPPEETLVVPAPSAFSLAAARLCWPLPETALLSLHGRELSRIRPHLHHGARILALTSDSEGPRRLARLLADLGFGNSRVTVLEALGGRCERVRSATAAGFALTGIAALNTVAIEVMAGADARVIPYGSGLDEALFEHDGQITKREIRAVTLSSLAPKRGQLLWDIGAGSGSVAIEWMLAHPSLSAIAIEARPDRAARIGRNAAALGVPSLEVVEGRAPKALAGLPTPDAIFIGGGASGDGVIDAAIGALRTGGRLVVNAVTLETEGLIISYHARFGGELTRIAVARADAVGGKLGWRTALPVTQFNWIKP